MGIRHFLKELADYFRFSWKTPKSNKSIVFYSEHEGYYPNFEGLIEEITGKHEQTICYITSDPKDPILNTSEPRIKPFYLSKLLPFLMAMVDCKAFVITMTDLNQFHIKRSMNPVHYFYVFHSLVSTHMMYLGGAFDHYDTIFCTGPHHEKEIRKREELNNLPPKKLVEAGYYRLERVYEKYKNSSPSKSSSSTKGTILIAPSWGDANVLESCGQRLVGLLLDVGYEVIVRPHPETVRRSPDLVDRFASEFGEKPAFTLETSVATDDSMLKADVLICDCSGIALEYAFGTERPVLFLDVPLKIRNPEYDDLGMEPLELSLRTKMGVVASSEDLDAIPQVIAELQTKSESYKKSIAELREQNVYAFGRSSEIGARCIIDALTETTEKKESAST